MTLRRAALVAALPLLLAAPAPAPALAAPAAPAAPSGLYGRQDPTYDGVFRQSLAVLALQSAGVTPARAAVTWLTSQQCADGGFASFRADVTKPCVVKAEDSNATSVAAQALQALGSTAAAGKAVDWLLAHRNADGGIGFNPGNASDANSTGLLLSALAATKRAAADTGAVSVLGRLQLGCGVPEADRGALDYQQEAASAANPSATAQGLLGLAGGFLPVPPATVDDASPTLACPAPATPDRATVAAAASGWLARAITKGGGALVSSFGSGKDYGTTADAVLALVASGHGAAAVATATDALAHVATTWPKDAKGADRPAALAELALAAHAAGHDAASFGGTNLVRRLAATLTVTSPSSSPPAPSPRPTVSTSASPAPSRSRSGGTPGGTGATTGGTTSTPSGAGAPPGGGVPTGTTPGGGESSGNLPATGGGSGMLVGIGAALLAVGGTLLGRARRRGRQA